jgi:hypothetical protein
MARRVFFHIGAPKTGTTFLQTVLWANRPVLERHGIRYPGTSSRDHLHASQVVRERRLPKRVRGRAHVWDHLVRDLAAWPGTGVLSHEFFGMASAAQASAAVRRLAPAEVHLVLTARDYVRQFSADWQESLKMNSDLSLDAFMDAARDGTLPRPWGWNSHDIVATLDRWGRAVPPERVHVVTVPRPGAPRDLLWRRWCEVIELDPAACNLDVAFANQSLGGAQAALLQRVKPHLSGPLRRSPEKHRWLRGYFAHEVLLAQRGERFGLRPEHAAELTDKSREAVTALRAAGYQVTGDLDELVPPPDPAPRPVPDDLPDSVLLEAATQALEHMIRDVRALTLERNDMRRRVGGRSGRSRSSEAHRD